jgi:hypothetical protein
MNRMSRRSFVSTAATGVAAVNVCQSPQSGIPVSDTGDCGPVRVFQSLRQSGYESIMHKAGHRHGDGSLFSRRQEQPVVLESKRQFQLRIRKRADGFKATSPQSLALRELLRHAGDLVAGLKD